MTAILGFVYSDQVQDETRSQYRDGWTRAIQAYRTPDSSDYDESANDAVDFFQENVSLLFINYYILLSSH